jgi:hypothetical protein
MSHDFKPNDAVVRKGDPSETILFIDSVRGDSLICQNPRDEKKKIYLDASQVVRKDYSNKGTDQ